MERGPCTVGGSLIMYGGGPHSVSGVFRTYLRPPGSSIKYLTVVTDQGSALQHTSQSVTRPIQARAQPASQSVTPALCAHYGRTGA